MSVDAFGHSCRNSCSLWCLRYQQVIIVKLQPAVLPEVFTKNTGIIWRRTWNCQAKNSHDWRNASLLKIACWNLFVEHSKNTFWWSWWCKNETNFSVQWYYSEANLRYAGRWERPGDKWNESISNSNVFFSSGFATDVTSDACFRTTYSFSRH